MRLAVFSVVAWAALWGIGQAAYAEGMNTLAKVIAYAIVVSAPLVAIVVLRAAWKWLRDTPHGTLRYHLAQWREQRRFHHQLQEYRKGAEAPFDPHIQHVVDQYNLTKDYLDE